MSGRLSFWAFVKSQHQEFLPFRRKRHWITKRPPILSLACCLILCIAKLHDRVPSSYPITFLHLNRVSLPPYCTVQSVAALSPCACLNPLTTTLGLDSQRSRFSVVSSSLVRLMALRQSTDNIDINERQSHVPVKQHPRFRNGFVTTL
jgi:hypothetical protein